MYGRKKRFYDHIFNTNNNEVLSASDKDYIDNHHKTYDNNCWKYKYDNNDNVLGYSLCVNHGYVCIDNCYNIGINKLFPRDILRNIMSYISDDNGQDNVLTIDWNIYNQTPFGFYCDKINIENLIELFKYALCGLYSGKRTTSYDIKFINHTIFNMQKMNLSRSSVKKVHLTHITDINVYVDTEFYSKYKAKLTKNMISKLRSYIIFMMYCSEYIEMIDDRILGFFNDNNNLLEMNDTCYNIYHNSVLLTANIDEESCCNTRLNINIVRPYI